MRAKLGEGAAKRIALMMDDGRGEKGRRTGADRETLVRELRGRFSDVPEAAAFARILVARTRSLDELAARFTEALGESGAERIIHAGDRLVEKGRRKGEREGKREGKHIGKRSTLLRQLRVRFGNLPKAAVARVQAARSSELDEMAVRFAKALPLGEILAEG